MKGPLESTKFYVLLALAAGPLHGTAIRRRMLGDTLGIYVGDSTLYAVLQSLVRDGLIELMSHERARLKVYQLTEAGRQRLALETGRLERALRLARVRAGDALRPGSVVASGPG
jgi:DNA-binding PadR family transcriptional regulator